MNLKNKNLFWNIVLVLFLASVAAGIYGASKSIDYIWRWERLPQYVVYSGFDEIRAPIDGTASINGNTVKITPPGDRATPAEVKAGKGLVISDGDTVFEGDVIAKHKFYRMGPLLSGLLVTLEISIYSIFFAIIIGVMTGLARISKNPFLKKTFSLLY